MRSNIIASHRENMLQTELPVYLGNTSEVLSLNDGALFHYTKFESFLEIIESMTLRTSPLCRMNDLNEANIDDLDWGSGFLKMIEAERYVKERCSIISFTKNYRTGSFCQNGSNHPAMWAHYAEDSNGVCLVLDKHILDLLNRETLKGVFHKTGMVIYRHHCSPNDSIMNTICASASEFVHKNYKELFFIKHTDWKSEKEVRFFAESPEVFLNIKGAIKYIILGARLSKDKDRLQKLIEHIVTPGTQSYHCLVPRSFAEMQPSPYGYFTCSAAYVIERLLGRISELSKDYLTWERAQIT